MHLVPVDSNERIVWKSFVNRLGCKMERDFLSLSQINLIHLFIKSEINSCEQT